MWIGSTGPTSLRFGTMMRRILLDRARKRGAGKRGGKSPRVNLNDIPDLGSGHARELVALDEALTALAEVDPRKARVIELRFFGGLSVEETAEVLRSPRTPSCGTGGLPACGS